MLLAPTSVRNGSESVLSGSPESGRREGERDVAFQAGQP